MNCFNVRDVLINIAPDPLFAKLVPMKCIFVIFTFFECFFGCL